MRVSAKFLFKYFAGMAQLLQAFYTKAIFIFIADKIIHFCTELYGVALAVGHIAGFTFKMVSAAWAGFCFMLISGSKKTYFTVPETNIRTAAVITCCNQRETFMKDQAFFYG